MNFLHICADDQGGLLWRQTGEGRVQSEVDRYVETVSLKRLDHWKVRFCIFYEI
jgi:hypothetical protein